MEQLSSILDLRSDTVTLPTEAMLEAIRGAELGDDVYGEDPTVNRLEELAAEKMGKEAALLVTSGTQANLVSLMSNTKWGDGVILEKDSHIYWYEVGGLSAIGGLLPLPVNGHLGVLDPQCVKQAIRPKNIHFPETTLISIENTHNRAGGTIIHPDQIRAISEVAKDYNMRLYMDGARIFNAAIALGVDVTAFTKHVDNLMFCLSKGLSCPIGSVVVGSHDFIEKARKTRKILGGGMRQAGIIAAPGIIALNTMVQRLQKDHQNARLLAERLNKIGGLSVNLATVQTNIIQVNVSGLGIPASQFAEAAKEQGVLFLPIDTRRVRMVTHKDIRRNHILKVVDIIERVITKELFT
jgi:threonine aldolase